MTKLLAYIIKGRSDLASYYTKCCKMRRIVRLHNQDNISFLLTLKKVLFNKLIVLRYPEIVLRQPCSRISTLRPKGDFTSLLHSCVSLLYSPPPHLISFIAFSLHLTLSSLRVTTKFFLLCSLCVPPVASLPFSQRFCHFSCTASYRAVTKIFETALLFFFA